MIIHFNKEIIILKNPCSGGEKQKKNPILNPLDKKEKRAPENKEKRKYNPQQYYI